jgi:cytochrome c-type biogenesis protein CcmH
MKSATGTSMMGAGPRSQADIDANVQKLAERLKENPNDASGWAMLARSYISMGRYAEAAGAYAKATELNPGDADLLADYAFALAMANERKVDSNTLEIANRALKLDPENAKALQLIATAAFDSKDYKKAIETWEQLLKRVPADSEIAQALTERITEAKTLSGQK